MRIFAFVLIFVTAVTAWGDQSEPVVSHNKVKRLKIGISGRLAPSGYRVEKVVPGLSAAEAGIVPGDVIVSVDDIPAVSLKQLLRGIERGRGRTRPVSVVVERRGKLMIFPVTPAEVEVYPVVEALQGLLEEKVVLAVVIGPPGTDGSFASDTARLEWLVGIREAVTLHTRTFFDTNFKDEPNLQVVMVPAEQTHGAESGPTPGELGEIQRRTGATHLLTVDFSRTTGKDYLEDWIVRTLRAGEEILATDTVKSRQTR